MLIHVILLALATSIGNSLFGAEEHEALPVPPPTHAAALLSHKDLFIEGIVNPLSGHPSLQHTDLIAKAVEPLYLIRAFISPHIPCFDTVASKEQFLLYQFLQGHYRGWISFPHVRMRYKEIVKENQKTLGHQFITPTGAILTFTWQEGKFVLEKLIGANNLAPNGPTAQADPRNYTLKSQPDHTLILYAPDGTECHYQKGVYGDRTLVLLKYERLPHRKQRRYYYNQEGELSRVESWDDNHFNRYAVIEVENRNFSRHFTTHTGLHAHYQYEQNIAKGDYKEKHSKGAFSLSSPRFLTAVDSPYHPQEKDIYFPNLLLKSYEGTDDPFSCTYIKVENQLQLHSFNVQEEGRWNPLYNFTYNPPIYDNKEGGTWVKNSDGSSIYYHFNKQLLIDQIDHYDSAQILIKKRSITWDSNQRCQAIKVYDGKTDQLLVKTTFTYDQYGNPITEKRTGNLTGEGISTYLIKRKYSQDGFNLLLQEEPEEGASTHYFYLPSSNLLTAKFKKYEGKILLREFYEYDASFNLVCKIVDDGSSLEKENLIGISARKFTLIMRRDKTPHLHMPEWIVEKYLENGVEQILHKVHFHYDQHGYICQEDHYGHQDTFLHSIFKEYNERGELLAYTNPLGQQATYQYDNRGNCISSTNLSQQVITEQEYDPRNRLVEKTEHTVEGKIYTTYYKYDLNSRLIQTLDHFGNETTYTHDPICHQITLKTSHSIQAPYGVLPVTEISGYNALGQKVFKKDANGYVTQYSYNIYGDCTEMIYPDGAIEKFTYTKSGHLHSHQNEEGRIILYQRDPLGRILSKEYLTKDKIPYAKESYRYNGFHLVSETDKEGNTTHYTFDGAGRKIQKEFCGKQEKYSYHPNGQLAQKICGDQLLVNYRYDKLKRLVEVEESDLNGNTLRTISYSYDADGNRSSITRSIDGKVAKEFFSYDSLQRLNESRDAAGNITYRTYREDQKNSLGQKVLQVTRKDATDCVFTQLHDPYNNVVEEKFFDAQGKLQSHSQMSYDPLHHLIERREGIGDDLQIIRFTYTPRGKTATMTRAFGTSEERTIHYTYTPSGLIATKTLPSGVLITYHYNIEGCLIAVKSSDGTVNQTFEYDRLGRMVKSTDGKVILERELDPHGNVIQEKWSNGLCVYKSYDQLNRLCDLNVPTLGTLSYTYDPLHLKKATRKNVQGDILYSHGYESYDLSGNPLKANLICDLGEVTYSYNANGLITQISSPYFNETYHYDSLSNLVKIENGDSVKALNYDALSQLTEERTSTHHHIYRYDSLYNRRQEDSYSITVNKLNELILHPQGKVTQDLNGNLTHRCQNGFEFKYDALNRLVEAISGDMRIRFAYDSLNRKVSKTVEKIEQGILIQKEHEDYLYDGMHEIGARDHTRLWKQFRLLTWPKSYKLPQMVAIELNGTPYAVINDAQNNLRVFIDPATKQCDEIEYTAFGVQLKETAIPWQFAGKRLDPHLNLIDYGQRHYDPLLGRWITTDPAGFANGSNLYQFLLNNPYKYVDPDGRFAFALAFPLLMWGAELALPSLTAIVTPMVYGALTGAVAYGGYKAVQMFNESAAAKITNVYAPDRPLPRKNGKPVPDSDAAHTQLGTRDGEQGKYPQAREFDENGNAIKDADFTDHGRPDKHPNPHQHTHKPNPTGGTPQRGDPEPLEGWNYEN